jgi:uncharacterized protein (DUF486 family)
MYRIWRSSLLAVSVFSFDALFYYLLLLRIKEFFFFLLRSWGLAHFCYHLKITSLSDQN